MSLKCNSWAKDVKNSIDDLIKLYGKSSKSYNSNSYAVFDFDNTTCIFDVQDQCLIYQLETMSFEIKPDELLDVLTFDLNGLFNELIVDSVNAYRHLYDIYGPFSAEGLNEETQKRITSDLYWKEFASKMGTLAITLPKYIDNWKLRWLCGFTDNQVYDMCYKSCEKYSKLNTHELVIEGSSDIKSIVGPIKFSFINGLTVTDNIKELWKELDENGIDVWVCSSSELNQIRAAVDYFDLYNYCTGITAKTLEIDDHGKMLATYDYVNGYGYVKDMLGKWVKDIYPIKASCRDVGKIEAINNAIAVHYDGVGPIATFMDSSGDFNFCTEYNNTKLCVCFNRADRSVCDGGGLISELAIYQRDTLSYTLKTANKNNDTLYVLQGRDENGARKFINSNSSIIYGQKNSLLFKNEDNMRMALYFADHRMSTKDIVNIFCIETIVDNNNEIGIHYGFLTNFAGYHNIK